jgi:pyruvate dehydrogenase E1 component
VATPTAYETELDLATLDEVQRRVLWLAASIVHHANRVRTNRSGVKVGGHQASSASMVSLMTALWFGVLEAPDRVSVKPHASPVLHALNYLLGRLDRSYLTTLRQFGGLQSYPSRTKDPDPVDYSTGSVGLGATAPVWGALAHRYVAGHFDVPVGGRQIALIGDAELDEGACWEAIADPMVSKLGEVMWVVDLNRQSLDRVVPDIAAGRLQAMFEAAGWHSVMVKYGPRLAARPGLRGRIDLMPNEEYQRLLRAPAGELRERLEVDTSDLDDAELLATFRDLGGHDLGALIDGYRRADAVRDRPSAVFAYTIKGWTLPTEGHPANHSALLTEPQYAALGEQVGADPDDPWARFPDGSAAAELCAATARRLAREEPPFFAVNPPATPTDLGREHRGRESTQQAFGRFFVDLAREAPEVAERVVTVSPDVGTSTNLGGWINKAGIWSIGDRIDWFADDTDTLVRWRESDHGRHIELGIAEVNLVGLLGELGATWSRSGQPLLPVGTIYDPFLARARALVVRHLRGRAVDPRRHAERGDARARGRRAPVGAHAVDRDRAARLRGVRAGVRAGPRVDPAARALAARAPRRRVGVPAAVDAPDRPGAARRHARGGDRRRLPAARERDVAEGECDEGASRLAGETEYLDRGHGRARSGGARGG